MPSVEPAVPEPASVAVAPDAITIERTRWLSVSARMRVEPSGETALPSGALNRASAALPSTWPASVPHVPARVIICRVTSAMDRTQLPVSSETIKVCPLGVIARPRIPPVKDAPVPMPSTEDATSEPTTVSTTPVSNAIERTRPFCQSATYSVPPSGASARWNGALKRALVPTAST